MGNEVPCFANSTPYDVKISLYCDRSIELARKETSKHSFSAGGDGESGTSIKTKGKVSAELAKKANISAKYDYSRSSEADYTTNYVDLENSGFQIVNARTITKFEYLADSKKDWYLTLVVLMDNGPKVLYKNARFSSKKMMLGYT